MIPHTKLYVKYLHTYFYVLKLFVVELLLGHETCERDSREV